MVLGGRPIRGAGVMGLSWCLACYLQRIGSDFSREMWSAATRRESYEAPAAASPESSGRVPTNSVARQCAVPVD